MKTYRRLPGRHKGFLAGGVSTVWQSTDHLLSISRYWGNERYKRYYFEDIQSFTIQKTHLGKIQNAISALISIIFLVLAAYFGGIAAWPLGGLAAFTTLVLAINVLRGPTCAFYIKTAVRTERLLSANRLKTAAKVLGIVEPLILKYQGALSNSRLKQEWTSAAGTIKRPDRSVNPMPASAFHFNLHTYTFSLLVLLGMVETLFYFRQHVMVIVMESAVCFAIAILVIMALIRQYQYQMAEGLRWLTWTSAVSTGLYFAGGYVIFFYIAMENPRVISNQWEMMKYYGSLSPSSHPLLLGINLFTIGSALVLGIGGLMLVRRSKMKIRP